MIDALRIDVVELRRKLATRRSVQREATMPELAVGSTFVPEDEPVSVEVDLESVSNGVMVAGTIRAPWEGECRRCLETVRGAVEVDVQELFTDKGDPDEIYPTDGDEIDLRPDGARRDRVEPAPGAPVPSRLPRSRPGTVPGARRGRGPGRSAMGGLVRTAVQRLIAASMLRLRRRSL